MKLRNVVIGLFVGGVVAGMAWLARGAKECRWRSEQGLHIRRNVEWFSNQYERISKLGDEDLRHDYVTNFTCHACTLLKNENKTFNFRESVKTRRLTSVKVLKQDVFPSVVVV